MNALLIAAGALGILAAAIHGAGGEILVMRRLSTATLPSSRFGGAGMTRTIVHVTWHITTVAFLTAGCALVLAGAAFDGDTAKAIGAVGPVAFTGFAAVALVLGGYGQSPRMFVKHPGPLALTATAVLAWCGLL